MTKRTKKGPINRVLILEATKDEYIIVFDYGNGEAGVATTDADGGEGHLRTEYYQDRFTKDFTDLWTELSEGKMYSTDWDGSDIEHPFKEVVDEQVIDDAIAWLCVGCGKYDKTIKKMDKWNDFEEEIKKFL